MALSGATVWEIRSNATAGNLNGGGFVTGATGTDYSQQAAAQFNLTGVTSAGAGNVALTTSASNDMVGNIGHVISGTNFNTGWFEITSVVVGVSITFSTNSAGASISTGVGAAGVINIGGAISLGTAGTHSDDAFFESFASGNTCHIAGTGVGTGTYTPTAISVAAAGTTVLANRIIGYGSVRGDAPTGATRPTLAMAANTLSFTGASWQVYNIIVTTTVGSGLSMSGSGHAAGYCKVTNSSGTADRAALTVNASGGLFYANELISTNGHCITSTGNAFFIGNYLHDSKNGYTNNGGNAETSFIDNIFEKMSANCWTQTAAYSASGGAFFSNNTFYGAETPAGVGINVITTSDNIRGIGNIFYGLTTAITHADSGNTNSFFDYNDFFNNTTNRTNFAVGANDLAVNPNFVNTATHDFRVGASLKNKAYPGIFPGALTTGNKDMGAAQRAEPTLSSGSCG